MFTRKYILPLFASLLFFSACDSSKQPPAGSAQAAPYDLVQAGREINEANEQFITLFNNGDSTGLADMFTTDGKSLEPNVPAYTGKEAIRHHYALTMNNGANKLSLTTTGLWGDEKLLAEEGKFAIKNKKGVMMDEGKYIVLWKKTDGQWKLFRDIFNSDWPVPAPDKP